jgi:ArsR family transcriptional regulator
VPFLFPLTPAAYSAILLSSEITQYPGRCAIPRPLSHCDPSEHARLERKAPRHGVAALERAAGLFRALGDAPRLRILALLAQGEWCVSEIVGALQEKFSTVSQRLRVLRGEGLVVRRREGTHLFYALADRHVADLIDNALAHAHELETAPARGLRSEENVAREGGRS